MGFMEWLSRTMVIERAVGVLTYFIVVIYIFRAIKYKNDLSAKRALNIGLIILVFFSFICIPAESADLSRIREMTSSWGAMPFISFLGRYFFASSTPIGYLLYFLSAKIGIPGLLPAFCALIFYLNSFHIFRTLLDSNDYSRRSIAYAFLLFMSAGSFYEVISGVRCFMAFSLVMRFIFDEIYFDKTIIEHIIFFTIAALTHPAAIVLIILWLIYYTIFSRKKNRAHTIVNIITVLIFVFIGIRYGNVFIDEMVRKGTAFISSSESYSYYWEYIIGTLQLFVGLYILFTRRKYMRHNKTKMKDFAVLTGILYTLVIVLCFEYNIFHRYITAASFIFIPVVTETLTTYENEGWDRKCYVTIQLVTYLILPIACIRGNLSGFKYFLFT